MRVATWAIQEREVLLEGALARLPPSRKDEVAPALDVVLRAFVARLSGGAVHPRTVEQLRSTHGGGALLLAAQSVAAALRARADARAATSGAAGGSAPSALQEDRASISTALDELVELFDPGAGLELDIESAPSGEWAWSGPRPTLVHALDELARGPPPSADAPAPGAGMLLRIRATTVLAARALDGARATAFASGLVQQRSAPDELLLTAPAEAAGAGVDEGARSLVRAAAAVAGAAGSAAQQLAGAIVVVAGDDMLDAVVRAGALASHPGLIRLDEAAWARTGAGLAPAPAIAHAIDPGAAFGTDRWELSALLVRPPLFGRDEERTRLASLLSADVTRVPVAAPIAAPIADPADAATWVTTSSIAAHTTRSDAASLVGFTVDAPAVQAAPASPTVSVSVAVPVGARPVRDVRFEVTRDLGAEIAAASALGPLPPRVSAREARARAELARGVERAAAAGVERPILIALHGPAGIGKTSLVRAALREAGVVDDGAADAPVLWGRADNAEPLAPIAAMLRALADAPAGHPRAAARVRRLVEGLAERLSDSGAERDARELARLLPIVSALLGAEPDVTESGTALLDDVEPLLAAPRTASSEAPIARTTSRIRASLRRAFLLVAQALAVGASPHRTVVFVVPGAEALDAPSRDVLAFVCARLGGRARLLLLSTTRLKVPAAFEAAFRVERLELRGLAAGPARELVGALLDSDDQSVSLEPLLEKGRGSPLALVHAVRFAVEGGLLRRRDDRWDLGGLDARDIPGRLDRLLRARVERLPDETRILLSACALLGPVFLPAAAEFVGVRLGSSRDEVARALAFLVDTGFLSRVQHRPGAPLFRDDALGTAPLGSGAAGAAHDARPLAFEHPLVRLAAISVSGDDETARLHALVADALEATGAAADAAADRAVAVSLARHLLLAGRRKEALERFSVVVRRSALFDDRAAAAAVADEGLALLGAEDSAASLPFLLVLEECAAAEDRARHKQVLTRLVRAAEAHGDGRWRARALVRVARFNLALGDAALAEDAAARAVAALSAVPRAVSPTAAHGALGRLWVEAARVLASARAGRADLAGAAAALALARAALGPNGQITGDDEALAALDHMEGALCFERGEPAAALERLLAARGRRAALGDESGEAACLDLIAALYARRGRLATALALLEQALRLRDRVGDDEGRASTLRRQAEVLLIAGDDTAALAAALEARALARERGRDDKEIAAAFVAVRAHLSLGDVAAADTLVDAVRRRARTASAQIESAVLGARIRLARAAAATGAARERALRAASTRAKEAVALAEKHGAHGTTGAAHASGSASAALVAGVAVAGECRLLEGDPGGALSFAQQAVELYDALPQERLTAVVAVEDILGPYARILEAMGDDEEATAVRARATALLEERARQLPPHVRERFWAAPRRAALRQPSAREPGAAQ